MSVPDFAGARERLRLKAEQEAAEASAASAKAPEPAPVAAPAAPAEPPAPPATTPPPMPPVGGDGDTSMATIDLAALSAAIGDAVATAVQPIGEQVAELADKVSGLEGRVGGSGTSEEDALHQANLAFLSASADVKEQLEQRDNRKKEREETEHQVRLAVGIDSPTSSDDTSPGTGPEEWSDDRIIAYYREHRKMPDPDTVCVTPAQSIRLIPVLAEIHNQRRTKRRMWEREPRTL